MRTGFRLWESRSRLRPLTAALVALWLQSCGGGDDLNCGGPFCVTPPQPQQAARLEALSGEGQNGAPGRELDLPIEVLVTDGDGDPTPDVEVGFTVTKGGGTLTAPTARTDHDGRASVKWTLGAEPDTQTVQAAAVGASGSPLTGSPVTFSALATQPPPARLLLRQAPSDSVGNGVPFGQQPVVEVLDADSQPVPQVEVTASIGSGGGTLTGTATLRTDAAGRVAYTDLAIAGPAGPHTLSFAVADPPLAVASGTIQVGAGTSSQITGNEPLVYEATVNSPVTPAPSVTVKDKAGNPVPGAVVTFTADRDGSVSPMTVTADASGVAQVSSWTLGRSAGVVYSLTARLPGGGAAAVFTATARAGAAGKLDVTVQPSATARNGAVFDRQPVVQIVDQLGNPASQPNVRVVATISSGPSGTLQNASATTNASGVAAFIGLSLTGLVGDYTLSFSAPSLAGATSGQISLTAGPPRRLALVAPPSPTARSRVPLSTQPVVQLQDVSGNPVAQAGVPVTASLAGGEGSLGGGTTALTGADGRAAFSDLAIIGIPGPRTLRFANTGLGAEVTSGTITLPGVAAVAIVTAPPASVTVGTQLSAPASWALTDAAGQPVADVPVTLAASAGGVVEPSAATSDLNGVVQLQSWTVPQTAGSHYVDLQVPGADGSRVTVQAVPAAASRLLKVSGDSQSAPVGAELPEPLIVRAVDQFGNGVGGVTVQWRTCDGLGDYDVLTDADGYATAVQATGSEPGTFCVMGSSAGLADSPVQFSFTVTPAAGSVDTSAAAQLRRSAPPPAAPAVPAGARDSR